MYIDHQHFIFDSSRPHHPTSSQPFIYTFIFFVYLHLVPSSSTHQNSTSPSILNPQTSPTRLTMAGSKHGHSGFNADLFGHGKKRYRRSRKYTSPPDMTREKALKISECLGLLKHPPTPHPLTSPDQDDDDENNWEDVNVEAGVGLDGEYRADSPGNHYARHQQLLRRAEARARNQQKWKTLEAHLTASYLYLQNHTRNWTSHPSFSNYLSDEYQCLCSPVKVRQRHVDLIDLLGEFNFSFFFILIFDS